MSLIEGKQAYQQLCKRMLAASEIGVDTETTGLDWKKDRIVGLSLADDEKDGHFFFLPKPNDSVALNKVLSDPDIDKHWWNAKFDRHFFESAGFTVAGRCIDGYVLLHLLDENRNSGGKKGQYKLKPAAAEFFDPSAADTLDKLNDWLKENNKTFAQLESVPKQLLADYGANDPRITLGTNRVLLKRLKEAGIPQALIDTEIAIQDISYYMEKEGACIDEKFLKGYEKKLEAELEKPKAEMFKMAKKEFNPDSDTELRAVVVGLGWKPDSEAETNQDGTAKMNKYAFKDWDHPFAKALLDYRRISTVLETFVRGILIRLVKSKEGPKVHCSFDTARAVTGRWSSSDPNLQNVDKKSDARKAFIPKKGHEFWMFDYKQIEPVLLAYFSKSQPLIDAFQKGWDYHTFNASLALKKSYDKVTPDERSRFKALALATAYQAGAAKVAKMLNTAPEEGKRFLKEYYAALPDVKKFQKDTTEAILTTAQAAAEKVGRLTRNQDVGFMYDGKPIPWKFVPKHAGAKHLKVGEEPKTFTSNDPWNDPDYWRFKHWDVIEERGVIINPFGRQRHLLCREGYMAGNAKIQSTAADLLKVAMVRCANVAGVPVFQVHDEVIFQFKKGQGLKLAKQVKSCLESVQEFFPTVPIRVDVAMSAKSWADEKEVKL